MTSRRAHNPSPLAGEGGEHRDERCKPGEGADPSLGVSSSPPHPTPRLRSASPSPARGEGKKARVPVVATPDNARALRRAMTDAERKLWRALRARQFESAKFRRQVPVGSYVADFLCYRARLVIEVDGGQHAGSVRDKARDRWFERNRFRVLRFWNNDVLENIEGVLTAILQAIEDNEPRARVPSPAGGEGKPGLDTAAARQASRAAS